MSAKYLYNLFFIILSLTLLYSPIAYASDVVNSFVAALESIVFLNPISLIIGTIGTCAQGNCAGYYDQYVSDVGCRWRTPNDIGFTSYCNTEQILTIGIPESGTSCQLTATLTFYNDVGPHSADEQNSTFQLYRFTLSKDARYWPWYDPYNDTAAQNAAVISWLGSLDQTVGDGLVSPYDFSKGDSYFMANPNAAVATPLAEASYDQVCNAQGVCKVIDNTIPKNVFVAYIAKTNASYDTPKIPYDDKVVYGIQAWCSSDLTTSINFSGLVSCRSRASGLWGRSSAVPPNYALSYHNGLIPVTSETGNYYLTDAANKKIFAVPKSQYPQSYKDYQFEFKESQKPWNLDVNYPISTSIYYNGGSIPVIASTTPGRFGPQPNGKYYIIDSSGNKIYSANASEFQINDFKLNNPLSVFHSIQASCPSGYTLNARGICSGYGWNPFGGGMGYLSANPSSYSINYNGGQIPVTSETDRFGRVSNQFITDVNGNKIFAVGDTFKINEGSPTSPKFKVTYPLTVSKSGGGFFMRQSTVTGISLDGYNGGTYMPTFLDWTQSVQWPNRQNDIAGIYFFVGGEKYQYINQTTVSLVMDEFNPAPVEKFASLKGKFLSTGSGKAPTDTYSYLPYGWSSGNDILGPFAPITEASCPALLAISPPTVISATCNSVTLESLDKKEFNVIRRIKGGANFDLVKKFDFSSGGTFSDANLMPHTTYEYVLAEPAVAVRAKVPDTQISETYTFCRPSCKILSESVTIPELSSVDFKWQCASDTVPISCQVQSDDPKVSTHSGLNSRGSIKIYPSQDSRYTLTCTNVDGSVTLTPFNVNILKPGIKEVRP